MDSTVRRSIAAGAAAFVFLIMLIILWGGLGYNDATDWQVHQSIWSGKLSVIDRPGWYLTWWGKVSTYPRYVEYYYTAKGERGSNEGDESIRVTFNDTGTAQVGVFVKVKLPTIAEERLAFHEIFRGSPTSIRDAVEAHLTNCVKAAGPLMSSTENQAARKAEFNNIVEDMLGKGLFVMRRHTVELTDTVIENNDVEATAEKASGKVPVTSQVMKVQATEVITDPKTGEPQIASESPLKRYGMQVEQFSVVETEYDPDTLKQFQARKQSFLLAEQAKAEQQRAVQEKLKIQAEGESEVEKIRQEGEQKKMEAITAAEKESEVAELAKQKAVTEAQQKVEVAEQLKKETETQLEIAKIKVEIANSEKEAEIAAAEAKQKSLEIGGALSDEQKMLATLKAERDAKVAEALGKIQMPRLIINGGAGGEGGTGNLMDNLITMRLMDVMGILGEEDKTFVPKNRHQADARWSGTTEKPGVVVK